MCCKYKSSELKIAVTSLFKKKREKANKNDRINYTEITSLNADHKVYVFQLILYSKYVAFDNQNFRKYFGKLRIPVLGKYNNENAGHT
jgi:hypothetical protein